MPALPQELLERIVLYADHDTHITLLTVSRDFQVAVERLKYPRCAELGRGRPLAEILARYRGHRVQFLREVELTVTFPELKHTDEHPLACRETREDLHEIDRLFSNQIFALFTALKEHQDKTTTAEPSPPSITLRIKMGPQNDDGEKPCHHRRYTSWRLHLLNASSLPSLAFVHTLHFEAKDATHRPDDNAVRPLDLSALLWLTHALPGLTTLTCPYLYERDSPNYSTAAWNHYTHPWPGPRRDARHAFARALAPSPAAPTATPLPALSRATLHFSQLQQYGPALSRQDRPLPDLAYPLPHDPLSAALRAFSLNLVELDLRVQADASLFWPPAEASSAAEPTWPRLKRLRVELHPALPDGSWLFCGPRGEDPMGGGGYRITDEEHYPPLGPSERDEEVDAAFANEGGGAEEGEPCCFRVEPVRERVEEVLGAFARAVRRMPVVERADVGVYLAWAPGWEMEEEYEDEAPFGEDEESLHRWGVEYVRSEGGKAVVEWQVGEWRPSDELLELFESANDGGEVEMIWKDFEFIHMRTLDGEVVY
ncbi:hypothetical protein MPH_06993 [Macrophomina phaseolina MS6]|uniref:Uncharacterized protein n=1 Tax=Macrophomina phaseolina (strain MS6) TaxID=1126212 RepID=K2SG34_MACPH|nr:hypothetical protein MPH_06993 [Macrophomina phaseolina MS6]